MDKHDLKVLMSSRSSEWETPDELYSGMNSFFNFTLDAAATHENAKCEEHFTIEENGLEQSWEGHTVFCNPPYGRNISEWIKKGYKESQKDNNLKVFLLPVRSDTAAWFDFISRCSNIYFIKGRLKFNNRTLPSYKEDGSHKLSSATFPSTVVVFDRCREGKRRLQWTNRAFDKFW